jgi:hypothetical protein
MMQMLMLHQASQNADNSQQTQEAYRRQEQAVRQSVTNQMRNAALEQSLRMRQNWLLATADTARLPERLPVHNHGIRQYELIEARTSENHKQGPAIKRPLGLTASQYGGVKQVKHEPEPPSRTAAHR